MKHFVSFSLKPLILLSLCTFAFTDNFENNFYNNHGSVGLINIPTARFYNEEVYGVTIYDGTPDQKITITSNPYDWFEASFFIQIYKDYHIQALSIKIIKTKGLI